MKPTDGGGPASLDERIWEFLRIEQLRSFFVREKIWLLYLATVSGVAFSFDLYNFSLSIDEEIHGHHPGAKLEWVAQGRWGMYVLNKLLVPDTVVPFVPLLLTLTASLLAYAVFTKTLGDDSAWSRYLSAPLALTSPILYYVYTFSTFNFGIGIALFASAAGVWLVSRGGWRARAFALPLLCFAVGVYQAMVTLILTLFAFHLLGRVVSGAVSSRELIREGLTCLVVLGLSIAAYSALSHVFLWALDVEQQGYLGNYLNYDLSLGYLMRTADRVGELAFRYYSGDDRYYVYDIRSLLVLTAVSVLLTVLRVARANAGHGARLLGVLFLGLGLVCPFLLHFMNAGNMPTRSLVALPVALAAVVYFAAGVPAKVPRLLLGLLVVICFFNFSLVNARLSLAELMSWQADRVLATEVLSRIHDLDVELPAHRRRALSLVGRYIREESPIHLRYESIGASFFDWNGGNAHRVAFFLNTLGVHEFRGATLEEEVRLYPRVLDMPSWPHRGAVDVLDGVVVVKFGPYSQPQVERLCGYRKIDGLCD